LLEPSYVIAIPERLAGMVVAVAGIGAPEYVVDRPLSEIDAVALAITSVPAADPV
jgi:hypothetical protein